MAASAQRIQEQEAVIQQLLAKLETKFSAQHMPASQVANLDENVHRILEQAVRFKENQQQQAQQEARLGNLVNLLQSQLGGAPSESGGLLGTLLSAAPSLGLVGGSLGLGYAGARQLQAAQRHAASQPCPMVFAGTRTELQAHYKSAAQSSGNWKPIGRLYGPRRNSVTFDGNNLYSPDEVGPMVGPVVSLVLIRVDRDGSRSMWLPDPVSPHGEFTWYVMEG